MTILYNLEENMKKFYKFTSFFAFLSSITIFLLYMIKFVNNVIDYTKEENELSKSAISLLMENNLITGLVILMVGLALTSIISLLIKVSYKEKS